MRYICGTKNSRMHRASLVILVFPLFFLGCSTNNVTVEDSLGRFFDSAGVKGTFGLFDNGHGHFTIYNLASYRDSFYSPGQTFDIFQSLIAIQTGIKKDDSAASDTPIPYVADTFLRTRNTGVLPADLGAPPNFGQEFRDTGSVNALAFEILVNDIGRDTLQKWIDSLQYGNRKTKDRTEFWLDGTLKINCDEQLGLLKKLYFNQLPFFARTQEIVCRMMSSESNSVYRLSFKTAQVKKEDGHEIGWVMGWVEENKHPYFFVVSLESADGTKDLRQTGLEIAKKILQREGFFEGKK
jgi:beta-lactamase class D